MMNRTAAIFFVITIMFIALNRAEEHYRLQDLRQQESSVR